MDNPKYDDSKKGGYSYLEKLALVAQECMDPKEIGMADADEARNMLLGKKPVPPFFGDWMTFEASVVPLSIRAKWAFDDLKIKPDNRRDWEASWAESHKDEYHIQAIFRSGSVMAQVDQTFTDPIAGFADLMVKTSELLKKKFAELLEKDDGPAFKTRDDLKEENNGEGSAQQSPPADARP
jgi:hypothetical protein